MTDLAYQKIINELKNAIHDGKYADTMKLPDERSLSEQYNVSRSTIKRALSVLSHRGIIFKKRGSGTFINPLYLKNNNFFKYNGSNLGITDSFNVPGKTQSIKVLSFDVIKADETTKRDLFLKDDDFVYKIERLRYLDDEPFLIETSYIPIKLFPDLNSDIAKDSIFNYMEEQKNLKVTNSYLTISTEPSNENDQAQLALKDVEPVGIMSGIFFLNNGTPFEISTMRVHYKYMKYDTFITVS
ncbi:transcriptional regulator [Companilactobacillus sp. RD055328]|uniref:GntR family transcriptional regulator n=1 Tax=Companilactobacillus sp. RD055328 TaxID=2916634 RepID=UPI001FC7FE78|nr:GntR family transcriptional regulator [Companilactobacillus sp. RD055328]GKQ43384.1 transcriptional regulator [Companilactobacillus sp. RD055328]